MGDYTGYVVDNYCWDEPNHTGLDGTPLGSTPEKHVLHCMVISRCKASGYMMLEELGSPASDGSLYGSKYQLDSVGDELVVEMVEAEMQRGGDYPFDVKVTVTGTLTGNEVAVSKLCITPTKDNPSQSTICHEAPSAQSTATFTTTSVAGSMDTSTVASVSAATRGATSARTKAMTVAAVLLASSIAL